MRFLFIILFLSNWITSPILGQAIVLSDEATENLYELQKAKDSLFRINAIDSALKIIFEKIPENLFNSKLADQVFIGLDGERIKINEFNKPVVIYHASKFCKPCICEIPAINEIAKKYQGSLASIVIYSEYESPNDDFVNRYDDSVIVVKAIEYKSGGSIVEISKFFGLPISVFVDGNSIVQKIHLGASCMKKDDKGNIVRSKDDAYQINYSSIESNIVKMLN